MSDDRAATRAAHAALCATHGVRDLYEGDCRHFMIDAWLMQIRRYAYGVDNEPNPKEN